jgi:hypothetical protein
MAEIIRHVHHIVAVQAPFDEVAKSTQEIVDAAEGTAHATIYNGDTGECLAEIDPLPGKPEGLSKAGYSAAYSRGWDEMMERRAARAQKGQRTTDD